MKSQNYDQTIEESERRKQGAFFTPDIWVKEAHKMVSKSLGEDWKDKYTVWDNSCGSGNLTAGYEFKELYLSTLEEDQLVIAKERNPNATCFQHDFLSELVPTNFASSC